MNLIVFTGTFKKPPSLKNGVSYGYINFDKMAYSIVAFGDTANDMAKVQTNQLVLVEGKLQQNKYNEEWRVQIIANSIKVLNGETPQSLDDLQPIKEESANLDELELDDEYLPFNY